MNNDDDENLNEKLRIIIRDINSLLFVRNIKIKAKWAQI